MTIKGHQSRLQVFQRFIRKQNPTHATPRQVERFFNYLTYSGKSERTYNNYVGTLSKFFTWAVLKGYRKSSPMIDICRVKEPESLPTFFTRDELKRIIYTPYPYSRNKRHKNQRDKLLYLLLATTGLRISEVINLNWGDIDFQNGYLIVRQGKGSKDRIVPLVNEVLYLLLIWKRQGCWAKQAKNPVFRNPQHKPRGKVRMKTGTINEQLKRHLVYCGIKKRASCHAFRHSFATQMLTAGVDPQTLATLAGWKSLKMLSVYVHLDVDHLKEAVDKHPLNHTAPFVL